jgi:hypothetical protein
MYDKLVRKNIFRALQVRLLHRSIPQLGEATAPIGHLKEKADAHHKAADAHHHDEHHHEEHHTDEDGRPFGLKPGQKYQREGWEIPYLTIFYGSIVLLIGSLALKPDYGVHTWAKEELLRRENASADILDKGGHSKDRQFLYHYMSLGRMVAETRKL